MTDRSFKILPVACNLGNIQSTSLKGALAFYKKKPLSKKVEKPFLELDQNNEKLLLERIQLFNERLASQLRSYLQKDYFPILIGGDHSLAIGSWSGVISHYKREQNFALIWIDAHLDIHTPETSFSGNYHGMPVAHLLGMGNEGLRKIASKKTKLSPKHIVFIGIRDYEPEEMARVKALGIKCYEMEIVNKKGFQHVFKEAMDYLESQTDYMGISLDLDAFDPAEVPDVATPVPDGIAPSALLDVIEGLGYHPKIKAFEIVEYSPKIRDDGVTSKLIASIIDSFLKK